jgi:hypothetical protein
MWLLETSGKMAVGLVVTVAFKWLDAWLFLRARLMYRWYTWTLRKERPEGHVVCPTCYGKGSYKNHPVCPVCHVPNQTPEQQGYMTYDRFQLIWDSKWWKPRRAWAGFHLTYLPDYVVQGFSPRGQRDYREAQEAPYKDWRTPWKAS